MTPQDLLDHYDSGRLWTAAPSADAGFDVPTAYQHALAVRALRMGRGEIPLGFKIGFTNRTIWERYQVFGPIWGTVWNTTVALCEGSGQLSLAGTCQPRLEPETVFVMRATPPADASLEQLFDAIGWLAPGFEVVHTHAKDWLFAAADTVADGGLHARLLIGRKIPLRELARNAAELDALLGAAQLDLCKGDTVVEQGLGSNVLDSPLRALHHFLQELRACPGAPDLASGDVITTGTWTDAWPIEAGQRWTARFTPPLPSLTVDFQ